MYRYQALISHFRNELIPARSSYSCMIYGNMAAKKVEINFWSFRVCTVEEDVCSRGNAGYDNLEPSVASGQKKISRSQKLVMQREENCDKTWKWKRVVLLSLWRPLRDLPASQQRGRNKGEQPLYSTWLYGASGSCPFWLVGDKVWYLFLYCLMTKVHQFIAHAYIKV